MHFPAVPATFIHVSKVGGTSLKQWAINSSLEYQLPPLTNDVIANEIIPNRHYLQSLWGDLGTTFTFVRNPYSRLVSAYHYIGQQAEKRLEYAKSVTKNEWNTTHHRQNKILSLSIIEELSLISLYREGFEYWVLSGFDSLYQQARGYSKWYLKDYWNKQTQCSTFCGIMPDIIIKIENIDAEFYKVQDLLDCNIAFPHINTTIHDKDYRKYYTAKSKQIVDSLFKEDLETFKYEF